MSVVVTEPDESLNYHHLRYFWLVVREGSVVAAAKRLGVSQPAVSLQIGQLEKSLGHALFDRRGRRWKLTEEGRLIHEYAQRIFGLGQEMIEAARHHHRASHKRLAVGAAESFPSMLVERVLHAMPGLRQLRIDCHTGTHAEIRINLAAGKLDVAITDVPVLLPPRGHIITRRVGESDVIFCASRRIIRQFGREFPQCLDGAPLILPAHDQPMRQLIDRWLLSHALRPKVLGEIGNADLLLTRASPMAIYAAHAICESAIRARYSVVPLGGIGVSLPIYVAVASEAIRVEGVQLCPPHDLPAQN